MKLYVHLRPDGSLDPKQFVSVDTDEPPWWKLTILGRTVWGSEHGVLEIASTREHILISILIGMSLGQSLQVLLS